MTTQVKEKNILKLEFCKFLWHILDYLNESNPTVSALVKKSAFICDRNFIQQIYIIIHYRIIIIRNIIAAYNRSDIYTKKFRTIKSRTKLNF